MLPPPFHNALVLTGPTGTGKTALGIELAQGMDAEIISMDSMALYRRMDIGTAKPSAAERRLVPHHLIDVLDPWESASVAWWLDQARRCSGVIEARGRQVLFVGGTPFYLKALMFGLFEAPPVDLAIRSRLEEEGRRLGGDTLHTRLAEVDPASARRLHANDVRRIIRALEVYEQTGRPLSAMQKQWEGKGQAIGTSRSGSNQRAQNDKSEQESLTPSILWLDLPRPDLYERINRRVDAMFTSKLVEEVKSLQTLERPLSREACQALGYKEVLAHLAGKAALAETIDQVKTRTRNFAKRQITWFRHLPGCIPATTELTRRLWERTMKGL